MNIKDTARSNVDLPHDNNYGHAFVTVSEKNLKQDQRSYFTWRTMLNICIINNLTRVSLLWDVYI